MWVVGRLDRYKRVVGNGFMVYRDKGVVGNMRGGYWVYRDEGVVGKVGDG